MEDKEITIYDIARALNVSPTTVSRGLKQHHSISEATRKKIFDKAKQMGYRFNVFASNLRRQRTSTIGVIVPRLNSSFMSDVLAGMEKVANEAGYNLIISQSLETMKKEIANAATMFNNRVDGLLVSLAYDTTNIKHFEPFISRGIPVIFFDRVQQHPQCPAIVIDNFRAAYDVTSHLVQQGCKRIAHVGGSQLRNVYADRLQGYRQALADKGLPFRKELVLLNNLVAPEIEAAIEKLLQLRSRPDGLFAASDSAAITCMQTLQRRGIRIPEQIAVAGFNNDPVSTVITPTLTTVHYPGREMGEMAVRTLVDHLNREQPLHLTQVLTLRTALLQRASTARKNT